MKKKQLLLTACMLAVASSSAWASSERAKTAGKDEIFIKKPEEYRSELATLAAELENEEKWPNWFKAHCDHSYFELLPGDLERIEGLIPEENKIKTTFRNNAFHFLNENKKTDVTTAQILNHIKNVKLASYKHALFYELKGISKFVTQSLSDQLLSTRYNRKKFLETVNPDGKMQRDSRQLRS